MDTDELSSNYHWVMLADWIKERQNIEGLYREECDKPRSNLYDKHPLSNILIIFIHFIYQSKAKHILTLINQNWSPTVF